MIDNLIYVKHLSAPEIDRREVLRYAGVREVDPQVEKMLDKCIGEAWEKLSYKACYRVFAVKMVGEEIDLGFSRTNSCSLIKTLDGCDKAVVFCATVGSELDRLIAKYNVLSPASAVLLQALGSERVEALCDEVCVDIKSMASDMGYACTRRFSPGYGDLPLELQKHIFRALDCTVKIGVNLNDDLFMTPSKSVTAIIGLRNVK